ncbi:MAG: substrate-binding domain-containing protein [Opitutaceae bacterium]|nr:substrate-binding domain-containing protein [Opitutaceae bacterium]
MSNKATLTDLVSFEAVYNHPITGISVATGSYNIHGWSPAFIIVVNRENPLTQISMKQLDGVFGTARNGGYVGSVWHTEYPYSRGPEENIRTWDQLGLTGEWAGKPIHVGGQTVRAGASTNFNDMILRGSGQWVDGYRGYANHISSGGDLVSWAQEARQYVAKDRYALFCVSPNSIGPELKELAVQAYEGGPYVTRTLETVHDRTYPLFNQQFFYLNRNPGQPVEPKAYEFLHYILSQEGQDCIQREGRYLPLTAAVVREQLRKLD